MSRFKWLAHSLVSGYLLHRNRVSPPIAPNLRLFGPDLIRAVAVLLVLVSHTFPWNYAAKATGTKVFTMCGYLTGFFGVEIFFVLSGYLIGAILLKDLFTKPDLVGQGLLNFWKRRWFRTLPNYYFFLAVYYVLSQCMDPSEISMICNYLWFGQAVINAHPVFFNPAWSLAVEEWFYLLFPMVLVVLARLFRSSNVACLLSIFLFLLIPLLLRAITRCESWDEGIRKMTFFRLDAVIYGLSLAYIKQRNLQFWIILQKSWKLGLIFTSSIIVWWGMNWSPDKILQGSAMSHRTIPFVGTSLCLFFLFPKVLMLNPQSSGSKSVFLRQILLKLSLWSYSIYLSHAFFIIVLTWLLAKISFPFSELRAGLNLVLIWALTIGFSAIWYRVFEKPLMDLRDYQRSC